MSKKDICSYNYDELKEEMLVIGEKAFRSKQIYEWLHVKLADDFDEMTNLSKALREKLKKNYPQSEDDRSSDIKSRPDGEVLIRTGRR